MVDRVSPQKRSEIMRSIRSANTRPELLVRKVLFRNGFRYRLYDRTLPGTPDIVLPKYKFVVFVHGCFWHAHNCKIGSARKLPTSNSEYWSRKIRGNVVRFSRDRRRLRKMGWKIAVVWECEAMQEVRMIGKLSSLMAAKAAERQAQAKGPVQ